MRSFGTRARDLFLIQQKARLPYTHRDKAATTVGSNDWIPAQPSSLSICCYRDIYNKTPVYRHTAHCSAWIWAAGTRRAKQVCYHGSPKAFCHSEICFLKHWAIRTGKAYTGKVSSSSSQTQSEGLTAGETRPHTDSALATTQVRTRTDPITPCIKSSIVPLSGAERSTKLDWQQSPVY